MKLTQTGAGSVSAGHLRPGKAAKVALQVVGDGATSYSIEGRAHPEAPFTPVIAAGTADQDAQLIDWLPELRLTVTGAGTVTAYIAEAVE